MKKAIFLPLILILLGLSIFVLAQTPQDNTQITYTPSSDKICIDGTCTLTLYSGIRNVIEDGGWKKVEDARSLKDQGFNVVYLENDPDFEIEVIDFNMNSIDLSLDFKGNWQNYSEYCSESNNDISCTFKLEEKYQVWNDELEDFDEVEIEYEQEFEWEEGQTKEKIELKILGNPFGKEFKFGGNSTTIQLSEPASLNISNDASTGTNPWINPENGASDDDVKTSAVCSGSGCHVFSNWLRFTNWSASIPEDSIIVGINIVIDKSHYCTFGCYGVVSMVLADDSIGTVQVDNTSEGFVNYGSSSYLWEEEWTPGDINDDSFGFVYKADSGAGPGGSASVWVDYAYINITYTVLSTTLNKPDDLSVQGTPITFNCSALSVEGLSNITLRIWNSTDDVFYNDTNVTTGFSNESIWTVPFTYDDTFEWNCLVYDNTSFYVWANSNFTFTTSLDSPAINLDKPIDNKYLNNGSNIYFNFTATDSNDLDTCELWGNWSGGWHKNYTWIGPTSAVQNFTIVNITEDSNYVWNVWCNDTLDNKDFRYENFTFTIDETYPTISIDDISTTPGSQTLTIINTVSDTNIDSCKYSIFDSTGAIDGINENVSFTCNSSFEATVTAYASYNLTIYAIDLASNENSTTTTFTVTEAGVTVGGGGVPEEVAKIPTIALKQIIGDKIYNELERAVFYARINTFCSIKVASQTLAIQDFSGECSIKKSDLEDIQGDMFIEGFPIEINDLILFYEKYNKRELEQVYMTLDIIKTYDLFTSVLGITNPMMVNPPRLDRPFIITSIDGNITIEHVFVVNKKVKECSIISGEGFQCEVITDNSVKMILYINDTDFFDKIFQGEMSITSDAEPENIEIKRISLVPRVYNLSYRILGIPAMVLLIILGFLILMFSIFFIARSRIRQKLKRRKS